MPAPDFALSVLKGLSHLAPHAHVLKLKKEDFSRDPKVTQALLDDPLLANEVQPTKTVAEMVRADERLKRDFKQFTLPLLIIHGTKDTVTRPEGSKEFYANAGSKDKTLKLYEGYFHDPLNDIGKEAVMDDIRALARRAHLPALSMLLERLDPLDRVLETHAVELGGDFTAYRNHAYRVVNFCAALAPCADAALEKIALAAAFHDLGIWTARTFDYLAPSIELACDHLAVRATPIGATMSPA